MQIRVSLIMVTIALLVAALILHGFAQHHAAAHRRIASIPTNEPCPQGSQKNGIALSRLSPAAIARIQNGIDEINQLDLSEREGMDDLYFCLGPNYRLYGRVRDGEFVPYEVGFYHQHTEFSIWGGAMRNIIQDETSGYEGICPEQEYPWAFLLQNDIDDDTLFAPRQ